MHCLVLFYHLCNALVWLPQLLLQCLQQGKDYARWDEVCGLYCHGSLSGCWQHDENADISTCHVVKVDDGSFPEAQPYLSLCALEYGDQPSKQLLKGPPEGGF
jgi:hypothetical protein